MIRVVIVLLALVVGRVAAAESSWHAGLDLRADLGTHPIRAGGGLTFDKLDTMLVLDPMFWTDGQHDIDLFATYNVADGGWGPLAGWRTSTIGIAGGTQLQQKLVLGVGATLPSINCLRIHWHFELATLVVKHGGDLPTQWISFATGRDFIDLLNFGMFVTVEYARPL
jgi:hypothetical protein